MAKRSFKPTKGIEIREGRVSDKTEGRVSDKTKIVVTAEPSVAAQPGDTIIIGSDGSLSTEGSSEGNLWLRKMAEELGRRARSQQRSEQTSRIVQQGFRA